MTDTKAVDPLGKIPRFVIYRGRRARVLSYDQGKFEILGPNDEKFLVSRDRLTFLPAKKKTSVQTEADGPGGTANGKGIAGS